MISIIVYWLIGTISILCAAYIIPGIKIERLSSAVWAAAALGVLNVLLKPILVFLTFPITFVTLGLFLVVINALMIMLAGEIVKGFRGRFLRLRPMGFIGDQCSLVPVSKDILRRNDEYRSPSAPCAPIKKKPRSPVAVAAFIWRLPG